MVSLYKGTWSSKRKRSVRCRISVAVVRGWVRLPNWQSDQGNVLYMRDMWWISLLGSQCWSSLTWFRPKFLRGLRGSKENTMSLTLSGLWLDLCFRWLTTIFTTQDFGFSFSVFIYGMLNSGSELTSCYLCFAAIPIWHTNWSFFIWDFQTGICCHSVLCGAFTSNFHSFWISSSQLVSYRVWKNT